jgi:hypothetical protein
MIHGWRGLRLQHRCPVDLAMAGSCDVSQRSANRRMPQNVFD